MLEMPDVHGGLEINKLQFLILKNMTFFNSQIL